MLFQNFFDIRNKPQSEIVSHIFMLFFIMKNIKFQAMFFCE